MSHRQARLQPSISHGVSVQLAAVRESEDRVLVSGVGEDGAAWRYALTKRAARQLWFDLTRMLFPEKAEEVLAQVNTIPSLPAFRPEQTDLTTWTFAAHKADGSCEITGWVGRPGWTVRISAAEMQRFWAALDVALFPAGWQS